MHILKYVYYTCSCFLNASRRFHFWIGLVKRKTSQKMEYTSTLGLHLVIPSKDIKGKLSESKTASVCTYPP